jgi:hypothetical protein
MTGSQPITRAPAINGGYASHPSRGPRAWQLSGHITARADRREESRSTRSTWPPTITTGPLSITMDRTYNDTAPHEWSLFLWQEILVRELHNSRAYLRTREHGLPTDLDVLSGVSGRPTDWQDKQASEPLSGRDDFSTRLVHCPKNKGQRPPTIQGCKTCKIHTTHKGITQPCCAFIRPLVRS